jgi:carbonic anhydrase
MTDSLIEGFKRFLAKYDNANAAPVDREYVIISCVDSLSDPGIIFDKPPGTYFGFRAPGAIVRPYKAGTALSATLDIALVSNRVRKIIVLGHTGCAAMSALVNGSDNEEIHSFVEQAKAGLARAKKLCGSQCAHEDLIRLTEEQTVLQSVENLKTYPTVAKHLKDGSLEIIAWVYDKNGVALKAHDPQSGQFKPINELRAAAE